MDIKNTSNMTHHIFKSLAVLALGAMLLAGCSTSKSLEKQLAKMPRKAMLLSEVKERGLTLDTLETIYPSGMFQWSADSVPQEYVLSWQKFIYSLRNALVAEGMNWTETYNLWGRAYFAPDGSVDHYFYTWRGKSQPTDEWKAQFREVMERFLATYRFEYPMNRRFAQCGGVILQPEK